MNVNEEAIETTGAITIMAILFFAIAFALAYDFILGNVLPNYSHLLSYDSGENEPTAYTAENHPYVFPGDEIRINLGERSLDRRHHLDGIYARHLNNKLEILNDSGGGMRDVITYKTSLSESNDVGWFEFEVPDNEDIYGKSIVANYGARFLFPVIYDSNKFRWQSRNVSGEITIKIGTQEQKQKAQIIFYIILIAGFLMVILTTFLSLAYFSRE